MPPAQTFQRAGQRRPTPSRWSCEGAGPAPSPARPAPPWPGSTPPCLHPSAVPAPAPRSAPAAARAGSGLPAPGSHGGAAGGRGGLLLPARLRRAAEPTARRGGRSRCGPAAPGTGSAAGPAALTWRPGAPGAGGQDGALPAALPAALRAAGAGGRRAGTRSPPGGGRAAALPASAAAGGCAGRGQPQPALPQGPAAAALPKRRSGGEAGRGGRAGSRPRPPAAETFGGVRGVGSGRELRAAARCGCGRSPRGPAAGAHLRTRPARGQGRLGSVYSVCPPDAARAAASRSTVPQRSPASLL